ncbi:uncharacterized protein BDZ99DRAFT_521385 [Mytilinidion resinicola]|uniref:Cyclin N-terminal domain-containing protein n=1 Tax=Mytilinidion resinicola TaxID=574789 RepID=A0A6A6YJ81_9PEZI|nr:uncharacterized protein BDZ99DRAFT_521385 [Mytilinidion resinicola]KAF2808912.1 hypothetical protein BDZ99DRAFT_521385 [Mytilinidion resinicola]
MASPSRAPPKPNPTSSNNATIALPKPTDHWSFASLLADILRLPPETIAMCFIYINRFTKYTRTATDAPKLDPHLNKPPQSQTLTLAALSLATKTTESPRRLRALLLPAHRLLHAHTRAYVPLTLNSQTYAGLRRTVVAAELLLLRVLRFDAHIPLPLDFLPRYLDRTVGEAGTADVDFDEWGRGEREEVGVCGFMETGVGRACRGVGVEACKDYRFANLFDARTVAAAVVWVVLRGRGLELGEGRAWVEEVAGGKVDGGDFEEAVGLLEGLRISTM